MHLGVNLIATHTACVRVAEFPWLSAHMHALRGILSERDVARRRTLIEQDFAVHTSRLGGPIVGNRVATVCAIAGVLTKLLILTGAKIIPIATGVARAIGVPISVCGAVRTTGAATTRRRPITDLAPRAGAGLAGRGGAGIAVITGCAVAHIGLPAGSARAGRRGAFVAVAGAVAWI